MVAIVTGLGLGLERSSGWVLGSRGQLGDQTFNRYGENVYVNAATGNLVINRTDEILIGQGPDDVLQRTYNSFGCNAYNHLGSYNGGGAAGDNWQLNASRRVGTLTGTRNVNGSTLTLYDWDGSEALYTCDTNVYTCKDGAGAYDTLTFNTTTSEWTWTDGNTRTTDIYNDVNTNNGRIKSSTDTDGNALTYSYNTSNQLTQVMTENGESTNLTWTANNLTQIVTKASDGTTLVTRVLYTYDTSNRLSTVTTDLSPADSVITDGAVVTTTYTYETGSDRIASISQTGGASLAITYVLVGSDYRVASLTQTMASGVTSATTFSYDTANRVTTITDALGQATKLFYFSTGNLKRIELPPAQSGADAQLIKFTYNDNGDVLTAKDASGNLTVYEYDTNGNLTLQQDALGNTIRWKYDLTTNALLTATRYVVPDPDGYATGAGASQPMTTRYAYDSENHLRFMVSAEGEVTEFQYWGNGNQDGNQRYSIVYRDHVYDVSGLAVDAAPSETTLTGWVGGLTDLSTEMRTKSTYDLRGNLETFVSYGSAGTDGSGLSGQPFTKVTYQYDQFGNLLNRQTSGVSGTTAFNSEVFTYDGLGRLTHSVDLKTAATDIVYTDGQNTTVVTLANGLHKTSIYNYAGQLISYAESGTGLTTATATYKYDSLGQLRMATDAMGRKSYCLYDAVGRKVASIAADGSIVEYGYDDSDRLVKTIAYASKLSQTQLNSLVDGSGNPANILLGDIRPTQPNADDQWEWRIYDKANRLIEIIDGKGGATVFAYDGASQLVSTTSYANFLTATNIAAYKTTTPTTLKIPAANTKDNISRNFYDDDGRLIGTLNGLGALTQIVYNEAGEKIETIAFINLTASNLRATGTFDALLASVTADSHDIHNRYFYDGRGLLRYTLNDNLHPTEYVYDALGHVLHTIEYGGVINPPTGAYSMSYVQGQITSLNLASSAGTAKTWEVYNTAGQLAYSIDATGAVTGYSYDLVTGQLTKQLRYATTRTTTSDPDFTTTMESWASGQATNAGNRDSSIVYDLAGRAAYGVDDQGFVTEYAYDTTGRVVHAFTYGGPIASTSTYSLSYVQGQIASLNLANNADTRKNWSVYDAVGRLAYSIDATGGVVTYGYDALGQIVKQVRYATLWTSSDPTLATMDTWASGQAATAGNRVSRMVYDVTGRLVYSVNAESFVTEYRYDTAGRVTLEIRYADAYTVDDTVTKTSLSTLIGTTPSSAIQTTYAYDATGRLTDSTDGLGVCTHLAYDALDRITDRTEGFGLSDARTTHYDFDDVGRLSDSYDALGTRTHFQYDALDRMTDKTGAYGTADARTDHYDYDVAGRLSDSYDALNVRTHFGYDVFGQMADRTAAYGTTAASTTHYDYDLVGRVSKETRASGQSEASTTRYVYDVFGDVTDRIEADNTADAATTHYVYDKLGRVMSETLAYGTAGDEPSTTSYTYDAFNDVLTKLDGRGNTTSYTYDKVGHVLTVTVPIDASNNAVTTYAYDAFGDVLTRIDPSSTNPGPITYFFYDKLGRVIWQVDAERYATQTSYTIGSAVSSVTHYATKVTGTIVPGTPPAVTANSAVDATTSFTRDKLDRVTQVTDAMGFYEKYTLNAFGDRIEVWNKSSTADVNQVVKITNVFDKLGRLLSETLPDTTKADGSTQAGIVNKFEYDARGNRTKMTEAYGLTEQRITTYSYDKMDRLTQTTHDAVQVVDPTTLLTVTGTVTPTEKITYDRRGNVIETEDAAGARTFFYYDDLNRKTWQVNALGTLSSWIYDDNGNATTCRVYGDAVTVPTDPTAAHPAPVSETNCRTTTYAYDRRNLLTMTTVADLRTGQYGTFYSSSASASVAIANTYDKFGNLVRQTDGNGNNVYFYYDKLGRKIAQVDQENYLTYFTLDADGNVTKEERFATKLSATPAISEDPSYIAGLRSGVAGNANDRVTNFTYDKDGRRKTEVRTGVLAYTVGSTGALTLASTTATVSYDYNGLGEVTKKTEATGEYTLYAYDVTGRQTSITSSAYTDYNGAQVQQITQEFYDGLNNVTKTVAQDTNPTQTTSSDRVTTYSYGAGGRLASMTDASGFITNYAYDAAGRTLKVSYARIHSDGIVNNSVTEASATRYDALGRAVFQSVATWNATNSTWSFGDSSQTQYNTFGEVSARGANGMWQETFAYDGGGRMVRSTAGDGTVRLYLYDGNGNQTLQISSSGAALPTSYYWSSITTDQAVSLLTPNGYSTGQHLGEAAVAGMTVTITLYDKRGQNVETREPLRQLDGSTTTTISHKRTYNAFGEVVQEIDPRNSSWITDFTYNTLGKIVQQQSPAVSYTDEAGAVHTSVRPTQRNYYDISGRLVGVQDANAVQYADSIQSPYARTNTRTLLSGTGYGDEEASVLKEFHADTGVYERKYDVFGDMRKEINEVGKTETFNYDAMARLTSQVHETRLANTVGNDTSSDITLTDTYVYDGLGHRTQHYNSQLGSTYKDLTDYDAQGRVVNMVDMGGNTTTYSYAWDGSVATLLASGNLGTFGAWTTTTTNSSGRTATETSDYFGRMVDKHDFGDNNNFTGHNYDFVYNLAGQLVTRTIDGAGATTYGYYNTGLIASVSTGSGSTLLESSYKYDAQGNRTFEGYKSAGTTWLQSATVAWDAVNRMTSFADTAATTGTPTITWEYDLNGNIRHMNAVYCQIDDNGNVLTGTDTTQSYWYKYDTMNRFTLTKGSLVSGAITLGTAGMAITYNVAGQRTSVQTPSYSTTWTEAEPPYLSHTYTTAATELYSYSADGYLAKVETAYDYSGITEWQDDHTEITASYTRDAMGRVTDLKEYSEGNGTTPAYRRQATYNSKSQLTQDIVTKGNTVATTTYDYNAETSAGSNTYTGAYQGGAVTHTHTYTTWSGDHSNADQRNTYVWWDSAVQSQTDYDSQINEGTVYPWHSYFTYDANGHLSHVEIDDGRPRDLDFINDANGMVLQRHEDEENREIGDPMEIHYYFNGMAVGDVSNNGTSDVDYATSIAEHTATYGSGPFRNGALNSANVNYADFDQSYDPINGLNYESTSSRYTVQSGDTLQNIAYTIWGDASFWYMIADANGLDGSETLTAGADLIIPNKVHNSHNSSDTYRVYDPNEAIGSTTPNLAKPPKHQSGGCGVMGQILLVVIAVVVTAVTAGALAWAFVPGITSLSAGMGAIAAGSLSTGTLIGIGAAAGAAGSIVSQGVGVLTGIQSKFDWGAVAMAAIGGGVSAGLGVAIPGSDFLPTVARGVLGNAITQGIGVATGLQKRFDWTGVAAAGVMAGVSNLVGGAIGVGAEGNSFMQNQLLGGIAGMAGVVAGAATRTLIDGSDFGDNILAMLPDAIGQTIGNMIAGAFSGPSSDTQDQPQAGEDGGQVGSSDGGEGTHFTDEVGYGDPQAYSAYLQAQPNAPGLYADPAASPLSFLTVAAVNVSADTLDVEGELDSDAFRRGLLKGLGIDHGEATRYMTGGDEIKLQEPDAIGWSNGLESVSPADAAALNMTDKIKTGTVGTSNRLGFVPVTADQLAQIMPGATRANIETMVGPLNDAMEEHGIDSPSQQAAFLGQGAAETGELDSLVENNFYYSSAARIHGIFTRNFPTLQSALPYERNAMGAQAFANRAYDGINGNIPGTSDGYDFRGRGFIQVTGRANYRDVGFETNPDALAQPDGAAESAARFWENHNLNTATQTTVTRATFDQHVTAVVNAGRHNADLRWDTYQRALGVLGH